MNFSAYHKESAWRTAAKKLLLSTILNGVQMFEIGAAVFLENVGDRSQNQCILIAILRK